MRVRWSVQEAKGAVSVMVTAGDPCPVLRMVGGWSAEQPRGSLAERALVTPILCILALALTQNGSMVTFKVSDELKLVKGSKRISLTRKRAFSL